MAGLNLRAGGYGGVNSANSPLYGQPSSYDSVAQAAFGPGVSVPMTSNASALSPSSGFGLATWVGIAAVIGLVAIRYSLPN